MSRNSEKSQSMLYRFREQQAAEAGVITAGRTRRPKVVQSVENSQVAEKWRGQVIKEIGQKVIKIQDMTLSEYQIRDLNDEINKLMREKTAWEFRIKELGGANYLRFGNKVFDDHGKEIPQIITGGGKNGYKYFGRARELPDVKELIEQEIKQRKMKQEQAVEEKIEYTKFRDLPAEYYGLNNAEGFENKSLLDKEREYSRHRFTQILNSKTEEQTKAEETFEPLDESIEQNVPTQEEIEKMLIERLRKKIQDQYDI